MSNVQNPVDELPVNEILVAYERFLDIFVTVFSSTANNESKTRIHLQNSGHGAHKFYTVNLT